MRAFCIFMLSCPSIKCFSVWSSLDLDSPFLVSLSLYHYCGLLITELDPLAPMSFLLYLSRMIGSLSWNLSTCLTFSVSILSALVMFRWVMEMRELTVVAGSFVGFQLLFSAFSPRLSFAITPGYGRLPSTKLTEWNSRCVALKHCSSPFNKPVLSQISDLIILFS